MPKFRFSALISLLLVFFSGVLVGGVSYRLYTVRTVSSASGRPGPPPGPRQSPEEVRKHLVEMMRQRVHLDDRQVQQLEAIYDQTREQFDQLFHKRNVEARALWDDQNEKIRQMLRPDQLPLYEQFRAERDARRHEGRDGRGRGGPPPR